MANPSLDQLKALAAALPPSSQIGTVELTAVVSGLAAYTEHGDAILKAAADGSEGIADFLHDVATKRAKDAGEPAPARGTTNARPATPVAPQVDQGIDYDKLAAAIAKGQKGTSPATGRKKSAASKSGAAA